jgi:POT family proton-dependent oligopeptide transporter
METKRQPKALPYLFLTEMWERFGFYVVQGMLILYLTEAFGFSDDKSYTIQGVFTALAYVAPIIGGILADRFLGFKTSIVWGGALLITGYAMLALPYESIFYPALATIIVGNGLFKPNISSLLGQLYDANDPRRDSGFTLFYVGINLGALLAGLISGTVKNHFGWHAGFALSSVGLVVGLCTFFLGLKWGDIKYKSPSLKKIKFFTRPWLFVYCLIAIVVVNFWLQSIVLSKWLLPVFGVFLLGYIFALIMKEDKRYRSQLILLNFLIFSSVVFWTLYLQIFSSANLFIDRLVDKEIFGLAIPTTVFYALVSLYIMFLGPLMAWSWQTLNESDRNPSPFIKFIFAIVMIGIGFLLLSASTHFTNAAHQVSLLWIIVAYFAITLGEMLLSPIGLSAVTILSPMHLTGTMMGIWFVALGFGGQFAGLIAKLSSIPKSITDPVAQLPIYGKAFFEYACLAFVVAAILFVMQFILRKWLAQSSN